MEKIMPFFHFALLTGFCLFLVVAPICAIISILYLQSQGNTSAGLIGMAGHCFYIPFWGAWLLFWGFNGYMELFLLCSALLLFAIPHCVNLYIANKNQSKNLKYGAIFGIISSLVGSIGFCMLMYGMCMSGS